MSDDTQFHDLPEADVDGGPEPIPSASPISDERFDAEPERNPEEALWAQIASEVDAATTPKRGKRLNPTLAKKIKQREDIGYEFVLLNTLDDDGNPATARVRRINVLDRAVIGALPKAMGQKVLEAQIERARAQQELRNRVKAGERPDLTKVILREMYRNEELADAYVIAGFIDPRVYATEEEADQKGGVWVEAINQADRTAYMAACEGQKEAVGLLAPFREEPEGPVADRGTMPDVPRQDPIGQAEAEDGPFPKLVAID